MQWLNMNQDQFLFLLYGLKVVASGGNGRIYQYDHRMLAKVYLNFLGDCCKNFEVEEIISRVLKWSNEEKLMKMVYSSYETNYERIFRISKRLENTSCFHLIQGALLYQDFVLASLLLDYTKEGYVVYKDVCQGYCLEENLVILDKIRDQVCGLMQEYVYPCDLKFGNVMVRREDLSVRLIDLDDRWTKYEDSRNCMYYAEVLNRLEKMKRKILQRK